MTRIYVAGPLFNSHERAYLEQIAAALETAGYATFLPHRDGEPVQEYTIEVRSRIFRTDLAELDASDLCVALLTGPDHDSGTSLELGYMYARGKPCIGISDDSRWLNSMIWGVCGEGSLIVRQIEELVPLVERVVAKNK